MRRFYPHGELASHVVGSTGIVDPDDVVEHGNGGVEMSFDDELSGRPGLARVYNDVRQNAYDSVVSRPPEPGTNLTLTHRSESAVRSREGAGRGGSQD